MGYLDQQVRGMVVITPLDSFLLYILFFSIFFFFPSNFSISIIFVFPLYINCLSKHVISLSDFKFILYQ